MRVGAEAEIRFATPIFQVVARLEASAREIRNFVAMDADAMETRDCRFIEVGDIVLARHGARAVSRSEHQKLTAQIAVVVDLQHVDGHVRSTNALDPIQRLIPTLVGLKRQAGDQVYVDIRDACVPQYRNVVYYCLRVVLSTGPGK